MSIISSPNNERIKAAQRLHRRRHRQKSQTMLIEGLRLVRDAWQAGVRPAVLFVAPNMVAQNPPLLDLVAECEAAGVEVLACTDAIFSKLAETVTPQGIAAIVPLPEIAAPSAADLVLVLDRVRDPGNAGTLLRSAEAAGVQLAIFSPDTVDPFNDKVMRAGMGVHFRLPIHGCATWSCVERTLAPGTSIYLAEADATRAYDTVDWRRPSTLIIGGEADGARREARTRATAISIPMQGSVESLNAGVAGAVILFEASRQRRSDRT